MMGADYFESNEEKARNAAAGIPPIGIGRECEIRKAIIDKNARIGNGVKLINAKSTRDEQTDNYVIVNGIIVVPKNGVIPDGTVI
jgi:glucose-1-phosphate adenylyltransferase